MKALTFEMTLEQPVLVARPSAGEENSLESQDFIPGSALRGALISLFLAHHPGVDVSHDAQCRNWFFTGDHCFLNGYPVYQSQTINERMLPRPLSWRVEKQEKNHESTTIEDYAILKNLTIDSPAIPPYEYAIFLNQNDVVLHNSLRELMPHNASLVRQVKKADDSFIFQYEVLSAGQTFAAAITGEQIDKLKETLGLEEKQILFLGGSRGSRYGRVRLHDIKIHKDWVECPPQGKAAPGKVILTLLSDAIFLDKTGQPSMTPEAYLECPPLVSFYKTRLVSGFNRKWGLPLPQSAALIAGSVFVFDPEKVDQNRLNRFMEKGMGERCVEGFGRIAINWNGSATLRRVPHTQVVSIGTNKPQLRSTSKELAQRMAESRLRSILEAKVLETIGIITIKNPPRKAQLAQLRQAAKLCQAQGKLDPLRDRFTEMKRTARRQFESSYVKCGLNSDQALGEWLQLGLVENLDEKVSFWNLLKPSQIPIVAGETTDRLQSIQVEYIARFIDGLIRRTIRLTQQDIVDEEGEE